jgi:hypothetical protein
VDSNTHSHTLFGNSKHQGLLQIVNPQFVQFNKLGSLWVLAFGSVPGRNDCFHVLPAYPPRQVKQSTPEARRAEEARRIGNTLRHRPIRLGQLTHGSRAVLKNVRPFRIERANHTASIEVEGARVPCDGGQGLTVIQLVARCTCSVVNVGSHLQAVAREALKASLASPLSYGKYLFVCEEGSNQRSLVVHINNAVLQNPVHAAQ